MAISKTNKAGKKFMMEEGHPPEDEAVVFSFAKAQKGEASLELEGRGVVGKLITNSTLNRSGIRINLKHMFRRKNQKREAWYDEEGRPICVTQSDEFGTKTLVMDDKGQLRPQTP